jgi:hypothetical protein
MFDFGTHNATSRTSAWKLDGFTLCEAFDSAQVPRASAAAQVNRRSAFVLEGSNE